MGRTAENCRYKEAGEVSIIQTHKTTYTTKKQGTRISLTWGEEVDSTGGHGKTKDKCKE